MRRTFLRRISLRLFTKQFDSVFKHLFQFNEQYINIAMAL